MLKRTGILLALLVAGLTTCPLYAETPAEKILAGWKSAFKVTESDAIEAISEEMDKLVAEDRFSGSVLITKQEEILLEKYAGFENREAGVPVTASTRFRIGSMNKMFTAVAILQLVETGAVNLDGTINSYLPGYPNREISSNVTVWHLLTHVGGTGDIFGPDWAKDRLKLKTHRDYIDRFGTRPPLFEPGKGFSYSNYGYVILGNIIESVSGNSYYDYVNKNIFGTAGMIHTGSLPETEHVSNRSVGYTWQDKWTQNTDTLPWRGMAAGGGYSTVKDLYRFARALLSEKLISRSMLDEATTRQNPYYGFGFGIKGKGKTFSFGHNGGAPGMNGILQVYPESGYIIACLSNMDPPVADNLALVFVERLHESFKE